MQSNPWIMWNPNSLDNSKIMLAQLYQASKRHTKNQLICIYKHSLYAFWSSSNKGIIILELKMHQHLVIPSNSLGKRKGSPTPEPSEKAKLLCDIF